MDPRLISGALAIVAVAAFVGSSYVSDASAAQALQSLGWLIAGWVGLRRPGDERPIALPTSANDSPEGDGR